MASNLTTLGKVAVIALWWTIGVLLSVAYVLTTTEFQLGFVTITLSVSLIMTFFLCFKWHIENINNKAQSYHNVELNFPEEIDKIRKNLQSIENSLKALENKQ